VAHYTIEVVIEVIAAPKRKKPPFGGRLPRVGGNFVSELDDGARHQDVEVFEGARVLNDRA
jgi:hypothetical protein